MPEFNLPLQPVYALLARKSYERLPTNIVLRLRRTTQSTIERAELHGVTRNRTIVRVCCCSGISKYVIHVAPAVSRSRLITRHGPTSEIFLAPVTATRSCPTFPHGGCLEFRIGNSDIDIIFLLTVSYNVLCAQTIRRTYGFDRASLKLSFPYLLQQNQRIMCRGKKCQKDEASIYR